MQYIIKKWFYLMAGLFLVAVLGSCTDNGQQDEQPDVSLLYGLWQEGSVFEHYYASPMNMVLPNGDTVQANGSTWDTDDDIDEKEFQPFNWTLNGTSLVHEHIGVFVTIPKVYTITKLTHNMFDYEDNYGKTHFFVKVE